MTNAPAELPDEKTTPLIGIKWNGSVLILRLVGPNIGQRESPIITEEFAPGKVVPEVTTWVTVCNLTDHRYGYRTIGDPVPYVVDLTTTDFSTSRRTPMPGAARFTPVTL